MSLDRYLAGFVFGAAVGIAVASPTKAPTEEMQQVPVVVPLWDVIPPQMDLYKEKPDNYFLASKPIYFL